MTRTLRAPVIAGNWKMHKSPDEAREFLAAFLEAHPEGDRAILFFPPAISVEAAVHAAAERGDVRVGVQNIHWEDEGAFTGEVSAGMAHDTGAQVVLVGHSERRHVFGETDEETGRKVAAALRHGLDVMLCVGETIEQRRAERVDEVILAQLDAGLAEVGTDVLDRISIAYEPVWAIGTGETATPEDASAAHGTLRRRLGQKYGGDAGSSVPLLYGGSVKPENARELLSAPDVDGVLVGGASLDPDSFARIAAAVRRGG